MCFKIDRAAKRPKQRTVFKVVCIDMDDELTSPFKRRTRWAQGDVKQIGKTDPTTRNEGINAHCGIYVCLSRKDAEAAVASRAWLAVLEPTVDPKDWLFTSDAEGALAHGSAFARVLSATYRKVKVARRQRYLEWVA